LTVAFAGQPIPTNTAGRQAFHRDYNDQSSQTTAAAIWAYFDGVLGDVDGDSSSLGCLSVRRRLRRRCRPAAADPGHQERHPGLQRAAASARCRLRDARFEQNVIVHRDAEWLVRNVEHHADFERQRLLDDLSERSGLGVLGHRGN